MSDKACFALQVLQTELTKIYDGFCSELLWIRGEVPGFDTILA